MLTCAVHGFYLAEGAEWNVQKAAIDDVKGIGNLVTDPGSLIDAGKYIWQHPGDAARQLVWDDESAKQWSHGNYVGAVSRGIWNVGSWFIPGVDIAKGISKTGKLAKLGELADKVGKLGRLARSAKAASKAADKAKRLAAKGDYEGARKAANEARRNADAAARQARKDGCAVALPLHTVPVLPHFGRYGAAALPACAMHESEQARQGRQAAEKAEKATKTPVSPAQAEQLVRDGERIGSGLKSDKFHRAASFVVDEIGKRGHVFLNTGGDGRPYTLIQLTGSMDGKAGRFEWIVDSQGRVTHQRFVQGGGISGKPNS